jgi:hypothetical protein
VAVIALLASWPAWSSDLAGTINENGEYIPEDKTVATTYKLPDLSAGFAYDVAAGRCRPVLTAEIFDRWTLKSDIGVGESLVFLGVGKRWTSVFEIATEAFVGWEFDEQAVTYGLAVLVIKF